MAKENNYTGIDVHEGLNGLRHRRSMYIGSTGILNEGQAPHALIQLSQEILSNSLDEALEGYGSEINITINEDQSMCITDKGRGMPKGPDKKFDDVIKAATIPHASGKFGSSGYQTSGIAGMNGIGVKITNAVSKYLSIEATTHQTTLNKGQKIHTGNIETYYIKFNGEEVIESEIKQVYNKKDIKWLTNNSFEYNNEIIFTGTSIEFLPDDGNVSEDKNQKVFESIEWTNKELFTRFESSAFLNAGLKLTFVDKRKKLEDGSYLKKEWYYENGLSDYVKVLAQGQNLLSGVKDPIAFNQTINQDGYDFTLHAALLFTDDITTQIVSFANSVPTKDGGPHYDGFVQGITKAFNDYLSNNQQLAKKLKTKNNLVQSDIIEGIISSFELKVPSELAEFDGQTKEKLSTAQAKKVTYDIVYEQLSNWLYDHEKQARTLLSKMVESKAAREAAIKSRQESKKARQSKNGGKLTLSSKLKAASSRKPEEKEMYITEGDSASNIKRNTRTQAIFPIRGKIKNAYKINLSEALKNNEISTITAAIGAGIGPAFELDEMQYHKICIAADSDSDGSHISVLLIGLFYKFFKPMIEAGRLYVVQAPLYRAVKYVKGVPHVKMYYNENEIDRDRQNLEGYEIQRYKGLGEMNKDEAYDAITNPKTRRLIQINLDDAEKASESMKILMGDNADLRKDWIEQYINFDELYELTL